MLEPRSASTGEDPRSKGVMVGFMRYQIVAVVSILVVALPGCGGSGGGGSAKQLRSVALESSVQYGIAGGAPLLLDAYVPEHDDGELLPGVIFLHGGGWVGGVREDNSGIALAFAEEGYATFSPSYRLATALLPAYPAQLDDAQQVIRWLRANSARFALDPNRVCVVGVSTGGHIGNLLATTDATKSDDPLLVPFSSRPNCVASLSAPSDLTVTFPEPLQSVITAVFPPATISEASPLFRIDARTPPILLLHGTEDEIVPYDQALRFRDALVVAGRPVELAPLQGGGHALSSPEQETQVTAELRLFFAEQLGG